MSKSHISGSYLIKYRPGDAAALRTISQVPLTDEDIALATSPENKSIMTYQEFEDGSGTQVSLKSTLMKKMDGEWKYTYGEEVSLSDLKLPSNGTFVSIKKGLVLNEIVKYCNGTVKTFRMTFGALGVQMEVCNSSEGGHQSTYFCERQEASIFGYFVMTKHENFDRMMTDAGLSAATTQKMLSHVSFRIVDKGDGLMTMIDYFGDGTSTSSTFRMGEEFQQEMFGESSYHMCTQSAPGQLLYTVKYKNKGQVDNWSGKFTKDGVIWECQKGGQLSVLHYRRHPDIDGDWKLVNTNNYEAYMTALGVPKEVQPVMAKEQFTMTFKYLGAGLWSYACNSKVLAHEPIQFRFGEEAILDFGAAGALSIIPCLTTDGIFEIKKYNGRVIKTNGKITDNFLYMEEEVLDHPGSLLQLIHIRV